MLKFFANPSNIYIALWCVYLLQGTLYPVGGVLSQSSLVLAILMSLWHVFKILSIPNKRPLFFRGLALLVLMYTIYGLVLFYTDGSHTQGLVLHPQTSNYLKGYYMSLLPFFSCYYFANKGYLTSKQLRRWVVVFVIVAVAEYYRMEREALESMFKSEGEVVNNAGYIMLSIIPCMLIFKKRLFQYIILIICLLFILFSVKRGAIMIGGVLVLFQLYHTLREMKGKQRLFFILGVVVVACVLIWYLRDTLFESRLFLERVESTKEGNSSGREDLFSTMINFYLNDATIIQQLIGVGADGTLKVASNYAHNDWLELLINQGLLGVFIFAFYWFCLYRTSISKNLSILSRRVLLMALIYTFLLSLFSMSIGELNIYVASIMGFALADGFRRDGYYSISDDTK